MIKIITVVILSITPSFILIAQNNKPEIVSVLPVHQEEGYFLGWPANNGVWSWEDGEIVVGFTRGPFVKKTTSMHFVDPPYQSWLARSFDGGYTWEAFQPEGFVSGFDPEGLTGDSMLIMKELKGPLDFNNNNFMMRFIGNGYLQPLVSESGFYYSYDRGKSWQGPFVLKGLTQAEELQGLKDFTPRTDYIIENGNSASVFLSVKTPEGSDKSFMARTTDGGLTFQFSGWIVDPEYDPYRAVMPSTIKTSSGGLVSAVRRREAKRRDLFPHCWIDIYNSEDNGKTWKFLSRAAETGIRNGNPPAMIQLDDGRLLLAYGNREHRQIRARFSMDEGKLWGPEIILRQGVQSDFGYPRLVQNNDGNIVTFYYWAESEDSEKIIEATIWDPGDKNALSKPVEISLN